ncbi:MAG: (d)CMP kinase [Nitrospinaceae bacterium]|nr:(d)CMP kinase [Nitrospinaceae bacterium]NIR57155.1 (d)CMP kinase [Nitrospinaceae bacterium]NIS87597.1 (d)CMP kinase [Nitrospinaceae bacterium]NIT84468.1 (d)CMP kinase [Nitrospinaceae bacterium]NIU46654.1 (d)CMP kinase [Nitrospinaceae bacterium]
MIIAIDGPAGSGKSTIARIIAERLKFKYIETGSMYRAVAWEAQQKGIDPADSERIAEVARRLTIEFQPGPEGQRVMVDRQDLTAELKSETIGHLAAMVAANPVVRDILVGQQRAMGRNGNVVMDGRDIGTVVFPNADKKFFMVANRKERARRRHEEMKEKNPDTTYERILEQLKQRDYEDENRAVSPLVPAADAIQLDTTELEIEEVIEAIMKALGRT